MMTIFMVGLGAALVVMIVGIGLALLQRCGAAATQGEDSFRFQQRYPSRKPVVRMNVSVQHENAKGRLYGREHR
jgi:hypothetical protein